MRVAIVYDCLFPHSVGGAERWYRELSERLARKHEVTYLTRRQWDRGAEPDAPAGVDVVAVSGGRELYTDSGRRRIDAPLRFGWGVFWYLLRHRRRFDVVHTAAFPYFSLIGASAACAFGGPRIVVDWHEVWTRGYWREYLGPVAGRVGELVQRLCVRLSRHAFTFSRLHAERLVAEGIRSRPVILPGEYRGGPAPEPVADPDPQVLFAARMIPEKRADAVPPAIAEARKSDPSITALILGDGPERERVIESVRALGLEGVVECPGFVAPERVDEEMRNSLCLLLPSEREGYGAVVVEAASAGVPSIVAAAPDNAAVELIAAGENGIVAPSGEPADLSAAILEIATDPGAWRRSTAEWFARTADSISVDASLERVEAVYRDLADQARS
jgi:glycosyltransferase involved in cell wall biosynthesis